MFSVYRPIRNSGGTDVTDPKYGPGQLVTLAGNEDFVVAPLDTVLGGQNDTIDMSHLTAA